MNESYKETMEFLYGINEQDTIDKEKYEKFIADNRNFDINDFRGPLKTKRADIGEEIFRQSKQNFARIASLCEEIL